MILPFAKVFSIVDRSRDLSIMVKWSTMEKTFAQNHFIMMDRSRDQSTIEKTFAQNHFTMMDRSRDQSTMEKTFAPNHFTMVDDKKLHDLIFSYDF